MAAVSYPPGAPAWVDLVTTDPVAMRAFYGELFGWSFDIGGPETGRYTYCLLDGARAAGMVGQGVSSMAPAWTTYFASADVDRTAQRIASAGGTVTMGPVDAGPAGRVVVASDPTGVTFGAWQGREHPGAGVVDAPGAVTWTQLATTDVEAAAGFYPAVLDQAWAARPAAGGGAPMVFSAGGQLAGGAMPIPASWPAAAGPGWVTYFGVIETDASIATVSRLGAQVLVGPENLPYGRSALLSDPAGAVFGLISVAGAATG